MYFRVGLLVSLLAPYLWAKPTRFEVRDPAQRDVISVISDIPMEKVIGLSSSLAGWIELDPEKLSDPVKGELTSDARTFDTGNSSRNDFLRDKVWNAPEGPAITFIPHKFLHISKGRFTNGQAVSFRLEGTLKYRGTSKQLTVLGKATWMKQTEATVAHRGPGNLLRVAANFDLDLSQFGFNIAEIQKGRLARYLQVGIDFVATDVTWTPTPAPQPVPPSEAPATKPDRS